MPHAISKNGKIQIYGVLPKSYHSEIANVLGGFDKLPNEELEKHGFYPVEYPTLKRHQSKGYIYFNKDSKIFKFSVTDNPLPSAESLQQQKISQLNKTKESLLNITKEIVFEALELGEEIPNKIKEERASIRKQFEEIKNEINTLNTSENLLDYNNTIKINTTI
tara:strand:+ start:421 stop:912 length:492 start_codon:yes stop_codon:yes gene_type:complete